MKFLIDTCVISEMLKPVPHQQVIQWINDVEEESLFLSSLTIGEIQKGISKLDLKEKREKLQTWLDRELVPRFGERILGIDHNVAQKWGEIQADAERRGVTMPVIDSLIASTGIVIGLTVVTRNIKDMKQSGVTLYNPWENE